MDQNEFSVNFLLRRVSVTCHQFFTLLSLIPKLTNFFRFRYLNDSIRILTDRGIIVQIPYEDDQSPFSAPKWNHVKHTSSRSYRGHVRVKLISVFSTENFGSKKHFIKARHERKNGAWSGSLDIVLVITNDSLVFRVI